MSLNIKILWFCLCCAMKFRGSSFWLSLTRLCLVRVGLWCWFFVWFSSQHLLSFLLSVTLRARWAASRWSGVWNLIHVFHEHNILWFKCISWFAPAGLFQCSRVAHLHLTEFLSGSVKAEDISACAYPAPLFFQGIHCWSVFLQKDSLLGCQRLCLGHMVNGELLVGGKGQYWRQDIKLGYLLLEKSLKLQ